MLLQLIVTMAVGADGGIGLQMICKHAVLCMPSFAVTLGGLPCLWSGEERAKRRAESSESKSRVRGDEFLLLRSYLKLTFNSCPARREKPMEPFIILEL